jgi:anti-sigma factor RsiW
MNSPDFSHHEDASADALIEAFLDETASPEERARVLASVDSEPEFRERLALATAIRDALRSTPGVHAPPDLIPGVMRVVRQEARTAILARARGWLSTAWHIDLRPVLAMATLAAVVVLASLAGRPGEERVDPEVAEALEQVKWTLALLSEVGERTAFHVQNDVLEPHVLGPMQSAIHHVFAEPQ